jgi:hypothetical protein
MESRQLDIEAPTHLYRYFASDGRLLYVGISVSAFLRHMQHRAQSHWFPDSGNMTWQTFETRREAIAAEAAAIRTERPIHNAVHNPDPSPESPLLALCCRLIAAAHDPQQLRRYQEPDLIEAAA